MEKTDWIDYNHTKKKILEIMDDKEVQQKIREIVDGAME